MQYKLNKKLIIVPTIVSAMLFSTLSFSDEIPNVLGNDNLRFGNTYNVEDDEILTIGDSVSASGMLLQPYYFNADDGVWYQLTYSDYPMDIGVGVGGDGTDNWNTNGTIVFTDGDFGDYEDDVEDEDVDDTDFFGVIQSRTIDYSAFTKQASSNTVDNKGYGVITSTIDLAIDGYDLEMKNTYELGENNAYIKITTTFTNIGTNTADNLRIWVGTRDDYVGDDDDPDKTRGNIVDGVFVPLTSSDEQSLALTITSEDTGVLFYSTSQTMHMVQEYCCNFEDVIEQNPATSWIISEDDDGSYGLFVRMNDLSINESETFTWFYGAGSVDSLANIALEVVDAAANSALTVREDGSVDLSGSFSDTDNNQYPKVQITLLPENGVLTLNDVTVLEGQEILLEEFDLLTYVPNVDYYGQDLLKWIGYTQVGGVWEWSDEADVVFVVERTLKNEIPVSAAAVASVSIESSGIAHTDVGEYAGEAGRFDVEQELTSVQTAAIPDELVENILAGSGIDFEISGDANMSVTITFNFEEDEEGVFGSYWKYGPETIGGPDVWYDLGSLSSNSGDPSTSGVGYDISNGGRSMTVTFIDGKFGDDDFSVNGVIEDPGFPALGVATTDHSSGNTGLSTTTTTVTITKGKAGSSGGSFSLFPILGLSILLFIRRKQLALK